MQVTFDAISQSYGEQALFQDLRLDIPSGMFFTLLGPSGCGKTTLLRMLAGFVRPDSGRILFGGDDVTRVPVHERGVGMVFQDYALFPDRSVLDNVCYGLSARNVPKAEARQRALAMLDRVGLKGFDQRSPAQLSGGQRQRVAMARALVIKPRLLLLDEPLSALDVKLRHELRSMVRELQLEAGITTVFVTHDQEEALAMSDQVAVMDRGRIVQIGAPREIYARPRTVFTADFVGSANLIDIGAELAPAANGMRRLDTPMGVVLTRSEIPLVPGARLAVRTEELYFVDAVTPAEGQIPGEVRLVEYRGSSTGYHIDTAGGVLRVDTLTAALPQPFARGARVVLGLPPSAHIVEPA